MRILEATIAVLIVSGVLMTIYSRQMEKEGGPTDYFYALQKQILMDISSSSDLRLMVLNGEEDRLRYFVDRKVPLAFSYFFRVCDFGDLWDFCKIDNVSIVAAIQDKEVFVEEVIVSADLGDGGDDVIYAPKKVRLFIWEEKRVGLFLGESCSDGEWNQDESDIDCGGFWCSRCSLSEFCFGNLDCLDGNCTDGVCY